MTAPHTDRYERRLFPPEQSLSKRQNRPAYNILYRNEATKFRGKKQTSPFFEIALVLVGA
jgi:hypothetical protein